MLPHSIARLCSALYAHSSELLREPVVAQFAHSKFLGRRSRSPRLLLVDITDVHRIIVSSSVDKKIITNLDEKEMSNTRPYLLISIY